MDDDITFIFKINYHPNQGDNIYIFGDSPDFGNWNEPKFKLNMTENDIWTGEYKLSKKSNCIEFKFVCYRDSNNIKWEKGENRLLDPNNLDGLSKTSDGKYILDCVWKFFKINFNLIYRVKEPNQKMKIKMNGELHQMEYQKGKIIKSKEGKEINEFWTVTILIENKDNLKEHFLNYHYNLFEEGKDINLLNKESGRQLRIFMKKDGKNNNNNNEGHNYLLTNSYLQIIDAIENEPSTSSSELKFHKIGDKKLYIGQCPNSDLDYKLLNQKRINSIIKLASDEDAEKEEYKEQLDKAKSFGIIIDIYQIEKNLNENDKLKKIKNISYEINKLKKDGKVIYICEDELSIEIIVSYLVLYEDFKANDAIDLCKK